MKLFCGFQLAENLYVLVRFVPTPPQTALDIELINP